MTYEEFLAEIDDLLTIALRLPFDKIFDIEKTLSYTWLPLARAQAIKEPPYTDLSNAGHFEVLKETLEPYLDDRQTIRKYRLKIHIDINIQASQTVAQRDSPVYFISDISNNRSGIQVPLSWILKYELN